MYYIKANNIPMGDVIGLLNSMTFSNMNKETLIVCKLRDVNILFKKRQETILNVIGG